MGILPQKLAKSVHPVVTSKQGSLSRRSLHKHPKSHPPLASMKPQLRSASRTSRRTHLSSLQITPTPKGPWKAQKTRCLRDVNSSSKQRDYKGSEPLNTKGNTARPGRLQLEAALTLRGTLLLLQQLEDLAEKAAQNEETIGLSGWTNLVARTRGLSFVPTGQMSSQGDPSAFTGSSPSDCADSVLQFSSHGPANCPPMLLQQHLGSFKSGAKTKTCPNPNP